MRAAAAVMLLCAGAAHADTYFVDSDVGVSGDGLSWGRAFVSVQEALDVVRPGDEIWVAEGVYVPEVPLGRSATFAIPSGVRVYGGFEGTETRLDQRDDPSDFPTVLSGELSPGNRVYNVVELVSTDAGTLIDGFEIRDGLADGVSSQNRDGAGVRMSGALGTIRNVVFAGCESAGRGGAVWIGGSSGSDFIYIENCTFDENRAAGSGGAIYSSLQMSIASCDFDSNVSETSGGAVYAQASGFSFIDDSRFFGNTVDEAAQTNGLAGALYVGDAGSFGLLRVTDTNFIRNFAGQVGAVYVGTSGTVELLGCGFYSNSADPSGSVNSASSLFYATSSSTARLVIDTCLFSGNEGFGIATTIFNLAFNSELYITNTSVVNNTSEGAISAGYMDLGGITRIYNTILWGNDADNGVGQNNNFFTNPTSDIEVYRSIIGQLGMNAPVPPGSNLSDEDPLFVNPVGGNGVPGDLDDNLTLMAGSPAIDAGNSLAVHPNVFFDFYGASRFADDTGTPDSGVSAGQSGIVDIGAAEFQGTTPTQCPADLNGDGELNFFDVSAFLTAYNSMDPVADFTGDGMYNFFDVSAFLSAYNAGCP